MTVGELTLVNTYTLMILSCVLDFLAFGKSYSRAKIAYSRLNGHLLTNSYAEGAIRLDSFDSVRICDLSFAYDDNAIFRSFNYIFNKGNIYGISGKNGIGKTTLLQIIIGIEKDYGGEVYIGEHPLRELDSYALRKSLISVVTQSPFLYFSDIEREFFVDGGTASENYNNLFDLDGDMINDCFRGKKGYSIGQKQKINIIQALNKNADLIILDEPTSALDNESSEKLADVLLEIKKRKNYYFCFS